MAHNTLRTFHLFAGAGGGILADLLLGHVPVGACEIEEYPRSVLLQRQRDGILPEFPIWDDIRTLYGKPWRGLVDVVCGGFPCQDISCAGKGEGIEGARSSMWFEMARFIREVKPRFVFVENSPMLTIRGLGAVIRDLAEMGYDARWGVFSSADLGAQHIRERFWLLADNAEKWTEPSLQSLCSEELSRKLRGVSWRERILGLHKSPIIRSRDEVAGWLDQHFAIGNGQDPIVAATAWRILSQ